MKRILVVNNDFDTMTLLKIWLENKDYEVKFTGKQEDVPCIIKEFEPGLIIVDEIQNEVVEKLKHNNDTREVPVLLMTGYTSRQVTSKLPADDVIEKPFILPLLEKKVKKLISRNMVNH